MCPRCGYVQRLWEGEYVCRKQTCHKIVRQERLKPIKGIPAEKINEWVAVTPGVHRYGTIPGIWELYLRDELVDLGVGVKGEHPTLAKTLDSKQAVEISTTDR